MNNLRNSVRLVGHLGMNPEIKEVANQKKLAKFSLATKEVYKNEAGEKVSDTQWHQLIAWGKQAQIAAKYLKKGHEIAIEGKLSSRSYTDKDGVKRFLTEIVVHEVLMISNPKNQH